MDRGFFMVRHRRIMRRQKWMGALQLQIALTSAAPVALIVLIGVAGLLTQVSMIVGFGLMFVCLVIGAVFFRPLCEREARLRHRVGQMSDDIEAEHGALARRELGRGHRRLAM